MKQMIDAILHIADVPALVAWFAENAPDKLTDDGTGIAGFARTPTVMRGAAALTYVRVTPGDAASFGAAPGVTVLAQAPYGGAPRGRDLYIGIHGRDPETGAFAAAPDDVQAADDTAAFYAAVWPREPVDLPDGDGGTITYTPPALFGQMG